MQVPVAALGLHDQTWFGRADSPVDLLLELHSISHMQHRSAISPSLVCERKRSTGLGCEYATHHYTTGHGGDMATQNGRASANCVATRCCVELPVHSICHPRYMTCRISKVSQSLVWKEKRISNHVVVEPEKMLRNMQIARIKARRDELFVVGWITTFVKLPRCYLTLVV
jgi:hypothetical protein